jgi:hypothetical protein
MITTIDLDKKQLLGVTVLQKLQWSGRVLWRLCPQHDFRILKTRIVTNLSSLAPTPTSSIVHTKRPNFSTFNLSETQSSPTMTIF